MLFPARKIRSACLRFNPGPLGPWVGKICSGAVCGLRLALPSQVAGIETCRARRLNAPLRSAVGAGALTRPPFWETRPGGRPKGLPYERYGTVSVENVGEGLKVNRPKAARSHPGVCPRRPKGFCPVFKSILVLDFL